MQVRRVCPGLPHFPQWQFPVQSLVAWFVGEGHCLLPHYCHLLVAALLEGDKILGIFTAEFPYLVVEVQLPFCSETSEKNFC